MSVLRRAYVEVEPDVTGFDDKLKEKFARTDPGGKAGKQLGGQLNRALKRVDLDAIDIRADPKQAFAKIGETEAKLRALSRNASTVEIKVRAEQALNEIGRFKKQSGGFAELGTKLGAEIGVSTSQGLFASLSGAFKPPPPQVLAAAGVLGLAIAPLLGATVAGGIIGGVGIGGVVGGLALAAKDSRVDAAATKVAGRIGDRLKAAASPFVGSALDGLNILEKGFQGVAGNIDSIFAKSSSFVRPLAQGAVEALTPIVKGIDALVDKGAPVIEGIRRGLAEVGSAVGDVFKSLSDNGVEAGLALEVVFSAVATAIRDVGAIINGLTEAFGFMVKVADKLGFLTDEGKQKLKGLRGATDDMGVSSTATATAMAVMSGQIKETAVDADKLKAAQDAVKVAQDAATAATERYNKSLLALTPGGQGAIAVVDGLRRAQQALYSTQIANVDANETYQASWDELSESVKANKGTLDINTTAGRSNRDALQALLTKNNELYFANIAAGTSIDSARKKHENRTVAVREEARRLGLDETATKSLINTYGKIPNKKSTNLVLSGLDKIANALTEVYYAQRALAEGIPIESVRGLERNKKGQGKQGLFSGHAEGGWTGPGSKYQPAGIVHADEYVIKKAARRRLEQKHPGLLDEMNATGQFHGHAEGGQVAPVDTSASWPFRTNIAGAYVMPLQKALSKVALQFGAWPSSPSAQRGDSGVWRKVVSLIRGTGPLSGAFGNAYRPGDPLWHGSGRAVDWMGFNQDALATFLASKKPLELIHRTARRDYAYTRGVNQGSFDEGLMNEHANHIHIAMDDGGFRTLQPGMNLIPNNTGRPELIGGPAALAATGDVHIHIHDSVIASERQAVDLVARAYKQAVYERKISVKS